MGLADLYTTLYGSEKTASNAEKTAEAEEVVEAEKIASIVDGLEDDECEKLAEACELLDGNGYEFESTEEKLAAAAEVVDGVEDGSIEIEESDDSEKVAAEFDAAGRIMARAFVDELNEDEEAPEKKIVLKR